VFLSAFAMVTDPSIDLLSTLRALPRLSIVGLTVIAMIVEVSVLPPLEIIKASPISIPVMSLTGISVLVASICFVDFKIHVLVPFASFATFALHSLQDESKVLSNPSLQAHLTKHFAFLQDLFFRDADEISAL